MSDLTEWLERYEKWRWQKISDSEIEAPEDILPALVRAGVYETCPSSNRRFIEPALLFFGPQVVNELLLDYLRIGDDFEKAGALSALYWAFALPFADEDDPWKPWIEKWRNIDYSTFKKERNLQIMHAFVDNENVPVRRSAVSLLTCWTGALDINEYDAQHHELIRQVIAIARKHPDSYIQNRIGLHSGITKQFQSMPSRKMKSPPESSWLTKIKSRFGI